MRASSEQNAGGRAIINRWSVFVATSVSELTCLHSLTLVATWRKRFRLGILPCVPLAHARGYKESAAAQARGRLTPAASGSSRWSIGRRPSAAGGERAATRQVGGESGAISWCWSVENWVWKIAQKFRESGKARVRHLRRRRTPGGHKPAAGRERSRPVAGRRRTPGKPRPVGRAGARGPGQCGFSPCRR